MDYASPVAYGERVQTRLRAAIDDDHTPHETGVSLSIGLFLTALPNFGLSIFLLGALGRRYERFNRLAFVAAIAILNPLAKGTVYVVSYIIGRVILGPVPGMTSSEVSLTAGPDVLLRLLLGNGIIAISLALVGYVVGRYGVRAARRYRD